VTGAASEVTALRRDINVHIMVLLSELVTTISIELHYSGCKFSHTAERGDN